MAGPIHGSIEHYLDFHTSNSGSVLDSFVNIYNFFNNNTGTLGYQRIAYFTGSKGTGMGNVRGINRSDTPTPAGENAFACFFQPNAQNPFAVLIQWTGGTAISGAVGNSSTWTTWIAIAQRVDGLNPWNGSTLNNGNDVRGWPTWNSGSSVLALYPRANDSRTGGVYGANKNAMMYAFGDYTAITRMHIVGDYDNLAIFVAPVTNHSYIPRTVFGKYTPFSGTNSEIPYFYIGNGSSANPWATVGTQYGTTAIGSGNDGGVSFPSLTTTTSGTYVVTVDRFTTTLMQTTYTQPNRTKNPPSFDEFPITLAIWDSAPYNDKCGYLGQHSEFFREMYNTSTHDTNMDRTRVVLGVNTQGSVKLSIPWHSGTIPGSGVTRYGVQF